MADIPRQPESAKNFILRRLVEETDITEEQARELIALLGYEWPSLLREARLLVKKKRWIY
ncbi:hypothetical protein [Mesorhizobium silamurunense]|uniref:hypothetical protein n=1 Tax=Mesorhizobium silamurunense TaxID=499528 RepID=UPI0017826A27|nr:hypothetical protein [Mesorhizobium silamurunense]